MQRSKVLTDLLHAAIGAKTHFDVWWTQGSEGRLRFPQAFTAHSDFLAAAQDAHYAAFFIYFAQMFDTRGDVSSIPTYLRLLKSETENGKHSALVAEYQALALRAEPLIKVRHTLVAHVNAVLTENDVFQPLHITWHEIRDRIYQSSGYVSRLAGAASPGEVGIPRDGRLSEVTLGALKALSPGKEDDA